MKKVVLLFTSLFFTQLVYSQQEYKLDTVVIASRTKENIKSIGKVVYKINAEDLVKFGGQSVAQALNTVPGVEINNAQGNFGSALGYFVRGGKTKDVLILIDGVPVGDPSQIDFSYDLNLLPLEQVASIEVIKGGNSALYGSNASAGVISITLKKNSKKKLEANVAASGGSFGTLQQDLQVGGQLGKFNYNVVGNNFTTKGISAAFGNNFEKDAGERQNILTQIGFKPTENISLTGFFQFNNQRNSIDGGSFTDSAVGIFTNKEINYGFQSEIKHSGKGNLSLLAKASQFDRSYVGSATFNSRNYFASVTESYEANKYLKLLAGAEFNLQNNTLLDFSNLITINAKNAEFKTINPYAGAVISFGNFNLIGNGRLNIHSNYDSKFVYSITPSYLFKVTDDYSISAKGSVSTAYTTPSLYQLFGGDGYTLAPVIAINPEESITYEGGLSFYFKEKFTLNSTYFYRESTNPLLYRSTIPTFFIGEYYNGKGQFNTKGVELDFKYQPTKKVTLGSAYTYTVLDNDLSQDRIPLNKVSSYLTLSDLLVKNNSFSILHTYNSERTDFGTVLNPYNLLSASVSQKINDKLKFNIFVNNILNSEYFESAGYTTKGINYMFGFNYKF